MKSTQVITIFSLFFAIGHTLVSINGASSSTQVRRVTRNDLFRDFNQELIHVFEASRYDYARLNKFLESMYILLRLDANTFLERLARVEDTLFATKKILHSDDYPIIINYLKDYANNAFLNSSVQPAKGNGGSLMSMAIEHFDLKKIAKDSALQAIIFLKAIDILLTHRPTISVVTRDNIYTIIIELRDKKIGGDVQIKDISGDSLSVELISSGDDGSVAPEPVSALQDAGAAGAPDSAALPPAVVEDPVNVEPVRRVPPQFGQWFRQQLRDPFGNKY